jgi:serine/threonine-protein kinase PknK
MEKYATIPLVMPSQEFMSGSFEIPGYGEVSLIGRGASSNVYKGYDADLTRWVAIKVLLNDASDDPARRRFKREGEITANLGKHPHIVQVLGTGFTADGYPYVVMEYFEQGSIGDRLRSSGAFSVDETIDVGEKIADAVAAAHKAGILHRDIKPQNILVSEYGPALADFGIARVAANLEWSQSLDQLTPMHSSPETLMGSASTAQSDIYALGSTLYAMLAGRAPFAGPTGESMLKYQVRVMQEPLPPIPRTDIPPDLLDVLQTALAKDPGTRFDSAVAFRDALRGCRRAQGAPAVLPSAGIEEGQLPLSPEVGLDLDTQLRGAARNTDFDERTINPPQPVLPFARPTAAPTGTTNPLPAPAMSPTPSANDGDALPSAAELTILREGRHSEQGVEEEPAKRSGLRRIIVGSALALIALAIVLAIVTTRGNTPSPQRSGGTPAPVVRAATDKPTITGVTRSGSGVTVTWDDPSAGNKQFIVEAEGGGKKHASSTAAGAGAYTFTGLSAGTDYCFTVEAFEGSQKDGRLVVGTPSSKCESR